MVIHHRQAQETLLKCCAGGRLGRRRLFATPRFLALLFFLLAPPFLALIGCRLAVRRALFLQSFDGFQTPRGRTGEIAAAEPIDQGGNEPVIIRLPGADLFQNFLGDETLGRARPTPFLAFSASSGGVESSAWQADSLHEGVKLPMIPEGISEGIFQARENVRTSRHGGYLGMRAA
jgi:hypothetical protein